MLNQRTLPRIGLGTFRLKDQDVIDSVTSALSLGYRHIDTAQFYDNERAVGEALKQSDVPRDEIFLTTKVWWDRLQPQALLESFEESCRQLGVEYVDLALVHWPSPDDEVPMADYIGALSQVREKGLTREIGVSNFTVAQLDQALSVLGGEHLITNQIEVHPFLANRTVVAHCQDKGLQVTGYMPLAVGKVMDEPVLKEIADAHGASPAQIALAWVAARDIVVIPSSTKPEHQKSNLEAMAITLSADEMARIDALDRGERIANPDFAPQWDA
ncbi:2,5-diketo-D-gluconate reductase B [Chromohalobacter canadensis]|uniref:2,5-diketo-D-gluconate reductase B n=1 Tax=Chromohalobacter canadensis TaxID=141389 RepID=A0A285VJ33_9GAMM|nr:2,5-didehydrogluconate reductase DkgB [Chromohalobacter canadensis]SOC54070.1 2,5-diketo-D-gluconate reductase B [Chromohalobacter canadensis]